MTKVVFTNGCFDIIHPGHLDLLARAKEFGDKLIVGINSDRSISAVKGKDRPIVNQDARAAVLLGTRFVDEVRIFDDLTPEKLIREIRPDVLVKGGDWLQNEIVGADFVKSYGGSLKIVPLAEGFSSSSIIEKIRNVDSSEVEAEILESDTDRIIDRGISEHIALFEKLLRDQRQNISAAISLIIDSLKSGKKVLVCGNGGSAADAQHIAAELVGRYETNRRSLPGIALTVDTSALTAIANDFTFDDIFSRQIEGLATDGDVLIAISTSGNSKNVVNAIMKARELNCKIIAFTGATGRKMAALCDACVIIPSTRTARIQEAHIAVAHLMCEAIDAAFPDVEK